MVKCDYAISYPGMAHKLGRSGGTSALAAAEAPAVGVALRGLLDVEEDAPDLLVVGAAPAVEQYAAAPSLEELGAKMALEHADAVGDGGRCDAEFLASMGEAPMPGGGLEKAQAVERRQGNHGFGRWEPWGADQTNTFFVFAQIYLFLNTSRDSAAQCQFAFACVHRGESAAKDE